jgi:acyl-CoA thioester hydrolase
LGVAYTELEKLGLNLPLTKVSCHYLLSAKYDQLLTVETKFDYIKRASIRFNSNIWDEEGKKLLVEVIQFMPAQIWKAKFAGYRNCFLI